MPPQIDHTILNVNDRAQSVEFYTQVLGFSYEGEREGTPFAVIRVTPDFMLQLAAVGTEGNQHLAFCMSRAEFDQAFQRIRDRLLAYGDSFDAVGNMRGPGNSDGARGPWKAVYLFDPNQHLIEIAYYE